MPAANELSERTNPGQSASASSQDPATGLSAGWTPARLRELADRVYELLLKELKLERERGA